MQNLIIKGDNIKGLKYLINEKGLKGRIDLVYIDPPFATNSHFTITDERASTISRSRKGDVAYSDKLSAADCLLLKYESISLL